MALFNILMAFGISMPIFAMLFGMEIYYNGFENSHRLVVYAMFIIVPIFGLHIVIKSKLNANEFISGSVTNFLDSSTSRNFMRGYLVNMAYVVSFLLVFVYSERPQFLIALSIIFAGLSYQYKYYYHSPLWNFFGYNFYYFNTSNNGKKSLICIIATQQALSKKFVENNLFLKLENGVLLAPKLKKKVE